MQVYTPQADHRISVQNIAYHRTHHYNAESIDLIKVRSLAYTILVLRILKKNKENHFGL
jgi:hypothetical protein